MAAKKPVAKKVNVKITRAIRYGGIVIPVVSGAKGKEVETIITVPEQFGRELIANAKATLTQEKANYTLAEKSDDDDLEAELAKAGA